MTAEKHLKHRYKIQFGDKWDRVAKIFDYYDMTDFAESYHQAKIEEEAEERYRKALSYYDKETYMNGKSTVAVVNAIRLASGKEGEG